MEILKTNILGVGVSAINIPIALDVIDCWIEHRERSYVTITGVHGVIESQRSEFLRRVHNEAGMVTPDGMPLVWINRLLGKAHVRRVYGPDLMIALCAHSVSRNYRHFFYGGSTGVPDRLRASLCVKIPGLRVVGCYSPPYRPLTQKEDAQVVQMLNASGADIIWVGLSTPKQEIWMAEHREKLNAPVLIGVGAAFDFHSGAKKQAPKWMQQSGLEWFFRLVSEPKRLWKRYLINNPTFVYLVTLQMLGIKRYSI